MRRRQLYLVDLIFTSLHLICHLLAQKDALTCLLRADKLRHLVLIRRSLHTCDCPILLPVQERVGLEHLVVLQLKPQSPSLKFISKPRLRLRPRPQRHRGTLKTRLIWQHAELTICGGAEGLGILAEILIIPIIRALPRLSMLLLETGLSVLEEWDYVF